MHYEMKIIFRDFLEFAYKNNLENCLQKYFKLGMQFQINFEI